MVVGVAVVVGVGAAAMRKVQEYQLADGGRVQGVFEHTSIMYPVCIDLQEQLTS